MPVDVLICDDHRLLGDALGSALRSRGFGVRVTYHPEECVAVAAARRPDVCLLDRHFAGGDGLLSLPAIRAASPGTRVIVLTGSSDRSVPGRALRAGAAGFVSKDRPLDDIVTAIERCRAGAPAMFAGRSSRQLGLVSPSPLTERELEVLRRLAEGRPTASVAVDLGITYATARAHIQSVLMKLGVHSKLEAVTVAMAEGLVPIPTR